MQINTSVSYPGNSCFMYTVSLVRNLKWLTVVFNKALNKKYNILSIYSVVASFKIKHELSHIKNTLCILDSKLNNYKKDFHLHMYLIGHSKVMWDME